MNNQIWNNLREIRKSKGLSLEQVAKEINIAPSSLSRLENSKSPNVSFKTIFDLSRYYDISLEKIISGKIEENKDFIYDNTEEITVSEEERPYYNMAMEARNEGLTVQQTRELISLFKKITSEIQRRNIPDEYCSLALKAKGHGISRSEFKSMVDILINNRDTKSNNEEN